MKDSTGNIYVSRAGHKLEQANQKFKVNFKNKTVLDVGSSTGGFTDYSLKHGADKVVAIEVGTNQMVSSLKSDSRVELHEKTDIIDVNAPGMKSNGVTLSFIPDIVVIDLSFISLKNVLPHLFKLVDNKTILIVLVKPQFEAEERDKNRGVIKNESIRRSILKDFETWVKKYFVIIDKTDSIISGASGNKERFYLLSKST